MLFSARGRRLGQSIMEYLLLIAIVTAAIATMLPRIKRSTQSLIKTGADQIGPQSGSEQSFNAGDSYVASSNTVTGTAKNYSRTDVNGTVRIDSQETTDTNSSMLTNSGWTQE